jgi:hypothetical protein
MGDRCEILSLCLGLSLSLSSPSPSVSFQRLYSHLFYFSRFKGLTVSALSSLSTFLAAHSHLLLILSLLQQGHYGVCTWWHGHGRAQHRDRRLSLLRRGGGRPARGSVRFFFLQPPYLLIS